MKHRKSHDIVFGESRHAGPGHLRSGFTLVIALVLMILLIILAVGLLSLAAIQLRQTSIAADHARARANARLAMQLAIGELQRTLGPDSRVSAPADALTVALGVVHADWQHTTAVLKHSEDALVPPNETPAAKIKREFIGWLVSGDPSHTSLPASAASAVPSALVLMKGATEMPDARAAPVSVLTAQTQGRYAWWVEDLGTKASMALPPQTDATLAILAPPRFDIPKIPDASAAPERNSELWNTLVTTGTSELVIPNAKAMIREAGRSVTALHRAVLADVAVGRLKRDLTVALEQTQATMETWLGQKIYDPVGNSGDPGGPHWEQLRQYYQSGTSGTLTVRRQTADQEGYYPVIAGLTEIYGISNTLGYAPSGAPVYAPNFYNKADANGIATSNVMAFHMSPVIKLWNPYDRPLKAPDGFTVAVTNGNSQHATSATDYDASYQDQIGWGRNGGIVVEVRPPKAMRYEHRYFIPATTIAPGETKIFCLTTNRFLDVDGTYLPFDATKDLGAKTNVTGNGWILGDLSDVTDSGGFTGHSFWDLNFTKLANVPLTDRERWNYTGGRAQQQPATGGDIQILDTVTTTNLEFRVIPHPFTT
jgi:Tfp pilus assembly protein PilV